MPTDQVAPGFQQYIVPYALIILFFYFLILKPQKDKQKEHKNMLNQLKKNDQVVTTGGIHGTIVNLKETTVILRVDDDAKLEIDKEAIAQLKKSNLSS